MSKRCQTGAACPIYYLEAVPCLNHEFTCHLKFAKSEEFCHCHLVKSSAKFATSSVENSIFDMVKTKQRHLSSTLISQAASKQPSSHRQVQEHSARATPKLVAWSTTPIWRCGQNSWHHHSEFEICNVIVSLVSLWTILKFLLDTFTN